MLLAALPPLIHIRGGLPQVRALRSALDLITFETEAMRPGGAAIGASLCSIVLVNILRAYLGHDGRPRGWLGALSDQHIGAALRLMHGNVAQRWKVSDLASEVGMSRTLFAQRFKSLVGMTPLEYLTRRRMTIARCAQAQGFESRHDSRNHWLRIRHRIQPGVQTYVRQQSRPLRTRMQRLTKAA
jgi:AraC-like DNA-binding protein